MKAFIDDLYTVRIEYEGYIEDVILLDKPLQWKATEGFFQWFVSNEPIQLQKADMIYINGIKIPLQIGLVTLTDLFEKTFRYDGPLGAIYTKDHTDFYVYTPVAKEVKLVLNDTIYPMQGDGIIYHVSVLGDVSYLPYYYEVRLVDTFVKTLDPYVSLTNHKDGFVNPNIQKAKAYSLKPLKKTEAFIYELHIRDATIGLDIKNKGTFLGLNEYSETLKGSVIDYIKSLGMTHIQLLPVFDFEGVDPINKSRFYNWGYNPKHYFSIQPWYSTQPSDPKQTQQDFISMIDAMHEKGLKVIMDVVYNHVFDYVTYPYDSFVPGYFYRHDDDYKMSNGSYCGNEVESRRYMVRRLIKDSLQSFVSHYQIDGFRFDLMGLTDVDTMNDIKKSLETINPNIMLYGEGWHMGDVLPDDIKASQKNHHKMLDIAHFNDTFRNKVKGGLHDDTLGFGTGGLIHVDEVIDLLEGTKSFYKDETYSVNYVECHDNQTLYDKLEANLKNKTHIKSYQMLSNALVAMSKGITFFHAGQEMFRTKFGVENSYNASDDINQIRYNIGEHQHYLKKIIAFKIETIGYHREYQIVDDMCILTLKKDATYHVIFKFNEKPVIINPTWGQLYIHYDCVDEKLIAPGMYIFKT